MTDDPGGSPALTHPTLAPIVRDGVADLIDRPRLIGEPVARTVLARVAWYAYQAGRHEAVRDLLTTAQVATALGISPLRVRQIAKQRAVGWQVEGTCWLFRAEDVERLRPYPTGRPRKYPSSA
jgi:hypothetical protein